MNKTNVLISISIGTLVYVLVSLFCGQNGVWAESQLAKQKQELCDNIYTIQSLHEQLVVESLALTKDIDVIAAYARKLGFVNDGEHIIKISGINPQTQKSYSIGKSYIRKPIQFIPEWICKILGFCFFGLSLLVNFLLSLSNKPSKVVYREVTNGNF